MRHILLALCLLSCTKAKPKLDIEPTGPGVVMDYKITSERVDKYRYGGFGIVSLKPDGSPTHLGEALIWGGTALWAMDCFNGAKINDELVSMIDAHNGGLIRVNPLGEYDGDRSITLDGALGLMLGISRRIQDCDEALQWREPLGRMILFENANGYRLNPSSQALILPFKYVRDLLYFVTAERASPAGESTAAEPDDDGLREVEKTVGDWAFAVQIAHETGVGSDACFRVNLGLTVFLTVETLGKEISQQGRNDFCYSTKKMGIPAVDHYCGRENLVDGYLKDYIPNQYEFQHQRCKWEDPDGDGNTSASLDKLEAMVLAYGWPDLQGHH